MKAFTKFLMMASIVITSSLIISCSSDDDASENAAVVGEWRSTTFTTRVFVDGELESTDVDTSDNKNYTEVTFNSDNTFTEYTYETFTNSNGEEVVEETIDSGEYRILDNSLTLLLNESVEIFEEFTVSENQLDLTFIESYTDANQDFVSRTTLSFDRK